jgi:hypothetical protein
MGLPGWRRVYNAAFAVLDWVFGLCAVGIVAIVAFLIWTAPPRTPAERAADEAASRQRAAKENDEEQFKLYLCHAAAACKKYSAVRLECATAGSFKTCLRIKMGEDSGYSDFCSGYVEGAPSVPLPPQTPNAVECFFRSLFD